MRFFRSPWELPKEVRSQDVFQGLSAILHIQEQMMAAIDDLTAAVTAAVSKIEALEAQLAAVPPSNGVTDTQLEGLASQLNAALNAPVAPATPTAS